jgi:ribosome-binding ATPase YchF (GTP1/OBG family)
LIKRGLRLLGLRTYFTCGPKEARAWTIHARRPRRPKAAGVIHTDFERGFIKPRRPSPTTTTSKCGSVAVAREKGLYRIEGKEYVVADGDVLHFVRLRVLEPRCPRGAVHRA